MNDIDTARIKEKFYTKLKEEKIAKNKKAKLSVIMAAATFFCLLSTSVFAAKMGVFDMLFSNFGDVAPYIQVKSEKSESNGVTMELKSYLADDYGIVAELVFTKDNGSAFANDTRAVGSYYPFCPVDTIIGGVSMRATQTDMVSEDGMAYYSLPIIIYDTETKSTDSIPLEISASKLIYNKDNRDETMEFDFYGAYTNARVKEFDYTPHDDNLQDLRALFNDIPDSPVQTDAGFTIHSVVFASVNAAPAEPQSDWDSTGNQEIEERLRAELEALRNDGVSGDDERITAIRTKLNSMFSRGLSTDASDRVRVIEENHIIGIKYSSIQSDGEKEYEITPSHVLVNGEPHGMCFTLDNEETSYFFFGLEDFEDLTDISGISLSITSNSFIEGDWRIETSFSSNINPNTFNINKTIETGHIETSLVLVKADVSLFSTVLTYEVRDGNGNRLPYVSEHDLNEYYYQKMPLRGGLKLLYDNGEEIDVLGASIRNAGIDGAIRISYEMRMNPGRYALMNTSRLMAISFGDEVFYTEDTN